MTDKEQFSNHLEKKNIGTEDEKLQLKVYIRPFQGALKFKAVFTQTAVHSGSMFSWWLLTSVAGLWLVE